MPSAGALGLPASTRKTNTFKEARQAVRNGGPDAYLPCERPRPQSTRCMRINSMIASNDLYLDLMMRCLTDWIYDGVDERARAEGRDWPARAHTMIGLKRLANLRMCVETILDDRVPGDLIETGVWRGGATIFMRAILKARNVTDRRVWVADSFAGLPAPDVAHYPSDEGITLLVVSCQLSVVSC